MVDGLAALLRRGQHDLEVLAQAGLADELVEVARPQRGLLGDLGLVGLRAEQLLSHAPARARQPQSAASRRSSSTVPSSPS